ncbi:unnamed protein product [Strongylus vulgaris]|uniref:Uncharacterized protein n=1 Tax=Strongylus vulgaris TaxID=40348 RepID=A0A3P7J559_STRVU|nr:unnamed protein product [Strongylus vulgaris]
MGGTVCSEDTIVIMCLAGSAPSCTDHGTEGFQPKGEGRREEEMGKETLPWGMYVDILMGGVK